MDPVFRLDSMRVPIWAAFGPVLPKAEAQTAPALMSAMEKYGLKVRLTIADHHYESRRKDLRKMNMSREILNSKKPF